MREVDWKDTRGRTYRYLMPEGSSDGDAGALGILVGPPDAVDVLGLPEPVASQLHNQLHRRGIFNVREARRRPNDLQGALLAALRVDVQMLMQALADADCEVIPAESGENGREA